MVKIENNDFLRASFVTPLFTKFASAEFIYLMRMVSISPVNRHRESLVQNNDKNNDKNEQKLRVAETRNRVRSTLIYRK